MTQQTTTTHGNGPSSLEPHGRHMAGLLLMQRSFSHLHFIVPHTIRPRRYPVAIKPLSTSTTCLDLAQDFSVRYYQQSIGKATASLCTAFGSLCNDASLVSSYERHIPISSNLWRSSRICITSGELIVCTSAALVFTPSSMPAPKSCG